MLLTLMVLCAVGAILIFGFEAFSDLWDAWSHPEHKGDEDHRNFPKSRAK